MNKNVFMALIFIAIHVCVHASENMSDEDKKIIPRHVGHIIDSPDNVVAYAEYYDGRTIRIPLAIVEEHLSEDRSRRYITFEDGFSFAVVLNNRSAHENENVDPHNNIAAAAVHNVRAHRVAPVAANNRCCTIN